MCGKLLLVSIFFGLIFFLESSPANANFNCTGTATSSWTSYSCPYNSFLGTYSCQPVPNPRSRSCTQDYTTGTCGGCLAVGSYQSCTVNADNTGCNVGTSNYTNDDQCGNGTGQFWITNGCSVTCSGTGYCDQNCNEYDTHLTGSGAGRTCTSNGVLYASNTIACNGFWGQSCPLATNGACNATHYNCDAGNSANNADAGTQWTWTCNSPNGGSNANCSENKPSYNVTVHVYDDYNGNGVQDGAEPSYQGANDVTYSGPTVNGTNSTDASGNYQITAIPNADSETISVNKPTGWTITTANPVPVTSSTTTVNFGIQPPAPTCSGGTVTATPNQIYVGGNPLPATSSLNIAGCVTGGGAPGAVTYTWTPATQGTITQVNAATTTYTPPAIGSTYTQVDIAPSVSVCNPGGVGATCKPYGGSLILLPTFSAAGQVFVDEDKNGQVNGTDHAYTDSSLSLTICAGNQPGGCTSPYETLTTNPANGTFTTVGATPLPSGSYTAILTLPSGYQAISPKPPVAVFTVGNASTGNTCAPNVNCDANGNILNLNFGISNTFPWMQAIGGDITGSYISNPAAGGFTDNIPATADPVCSGGAYALTLGTGGTHGLVNTGSGGADFGQGQEAAANSWLVGGIGAGNYPYVYNMPLSNQARTAYANLSFLVKQSNIVTKPLSGVSGCTDLSNCQLPADLPTGVYTADQNLTLNGGNGTYTFPAGKYVILVNGKLTINTKIFVPNGSFVLFSASDDINVTQNVGDVANSTASNLEGYYSTDKSFNVQSKDASGGGANCATNDEDLRLNVAGSIVVNAVTTNGGGFYYQRDMCASDKLCPVFTITERPDFILNVPTMLMFPRRVWQEVAP